MAKDFSYGNCTLHLSGDKIGKKPVLIQTDNSDTKFFLCRATTQDNRLKWAPKYLYLHIERSYENPLKEEDCRDAIFLAREVAEYMDYNLMVGYDAQNIMKSDHVHNGILVNGRSVPLFASEIDSLPADIPLNVVGFPSDDHILYFGKWRGSFGALRLLHYMYCMDFPEGRDINISLQTLHPFEMFEGGVKITHGNYRPLSLEESNIEYVNVGKITITDNSGGKVNSLSISGEMNPDKIPWSHDAAFPKQVYVKLKPIESTFSVRYPHDKKNSQLISRLPPKVDIYKKIQERLNKKLRYYDISMLGVEGANNRTMELSWQVERYISDGLDRRSERFFKELSEMHSRLEEIREKGLMNETDTMTPKLIREIEKVFDRNPELLTVVEKNDGPSPD